MALTQTIAKVKKMIEKFILGVVALLALTVSLPAQAQNIVSGNAVQTFDLEGVQIGSFDDVPKLLRERWDTHRDVRWDIAKPLSAIAYQVYEEEPIITRYFLSSMGFKRLIEIPYNTMYGYVAMSDDVMLISFRGTNLLSLRDWHVNCQTGQISFRGSLFHRGFVENYGAMRPAILDAIRKFQPKYLYVTGHSLGGALATICAMDITLSTALKPTLCTFGQPRVADSAGAKFLDEVLPGRYARFINGRDIVPSLPPKLPWNRTYGHGGDLYAFGNRKLTISESTLTVPATTTAFCDHCGRTIVGSVNAPIYQSIAELPPLSQQEYEALLRQEDLARRETFIPTTRNALPTQAYGIADRFLDHKMGKYLQAAHSFGSTEAALAIPSRQ